MTNPARADEGVSAATREWAAALSAGDCELMIHAALREGDVRGVVAALRLLVSKDVHRAQLLFDVVSTAVSLAKQGPQGRAGVAAELRAMAGVIEQGPGPDRPVGNPHTE